MRLLPRRRPKIEKLQRAQNVAHLQAALAYEDRYVARDGTIWDLGAPVRVGAAKALGEIGDEAAADALTTALWDAHPDVRVAVVEAISALGVPVDPGPVLDGIATWSRPEEDEAAERALAALIAERLEGLAPLLAQKVLARESPEPDDRDRSALIGLVGADPRPSAYDELAEALVAAMTEGEDGPAAARAEQMLVWLGPAGGNQLLHAFKQGPPGPGLVRAAGEIGEASLLEPLVEILQGEDAELRALAATALGALSDTRAVPALLAATQDPELPVRAAASGALDAGGIAAVIVGVASVIQDVAGAQLDQGAEPAALEASKSEPIAEAVEAQLAHPPTWAQEILGRLMKRRD